MDFSVTLDQLIIFLDEEETPSDTEAAIHI